MKPSALCLSQIMLVVIAGCIVVTACAAPSKPGTLAMETAAAPTTTLVLTELAPTAAPPGTAPPPAASPTTALDSAAPEAVPSGATSLAAASAPTGVAATAAAPGGVPFDILAGGESLVGQGSAPITLAIRGDDPDRAVPDDLPDEAKEALQRAFARPDSALYIVVYAGVQPSSGYRVRIDSITTRTEAGRAKLVVDYSLEEPGPDQGAAAVITHPFVIARVGNTDVGADDVLFQGP